MHKYTISLRIFIFLVNYLIISPTISIAQEGKLEDIRKETKEQDRKENKSSNNNNHRHHSKNSNSGDYSFLGEIFGPIIFYTIVSPYYLPHHYWDEGFSEPIYFQPYPYYLNNPGYLIDYETEFTKKGAIDISSEYKIYRDSVFGVGLNFNLRSNFRVEIQGDFNYLEEKLDNGNTDSLYLGNVNVLFRFAQNPYLLMRSGIGLNFLNDTEDEYGFNYTYSLDVFPVKPLFLSARIDLGGLGSAGFVRFRTAIGFIYKRLEANIGIETYNIGDASLVGLTGGLKWYF